MKQPKRMIFCHGDKGGVGKSTFARLMAEFCKTRHLDWHAYDTDSTNGHLMRFYQAHTTPVLIRDPKSVDQILNGLEGDHRILLVDLGARSGDIIYEWMAETDLLKLRQEMGFAITIAFVLDPVKDSTALLKEAAEKLKDAVQWVIVKNLAKGSEFGIYDGSKTRVKLQELKALEITLPELLEDAYRKVDACNLEWGEAVGDARLTLAQRQRVKAFVKAAFAEIEKANSHLVV